LVNSSFDCHATYKLHNLHWYQAHNEDGRGDQQERGMALHVQWDEILAAVRAVPSQQQQQSSTVQQCIRGQLPHQLSSYLSHQSPMKTPNPDGSFGATIRATSTTGICHLDASAIHNVPAGLAATASHSLANIQNKPRMQLEPYHLRV
jgi:hypothetical protein